MTEPILHPTELDLSYKTPVILNSCPCASSATKPSSLHPPAPNFFPLVRIPNFSSSFWLTSPSSPALCRSILTIIDFRRWSPSFPTNLQLSPISSNILHVHLRQSRSNQWLLGRPDHRRIHLVYRSFVLFPDLPQTPFLLYHLSFGPLLHRSFQRR